MRQAEGIAWKKMAGSNAFYDATARVGCVHRFILSRAASRAPGLSSRSPSIAQCHVADEVGMASPERAEARCLRDCGQGFEADAVAITARKDLRDEQLAFERVGFHRRPVWVDTDEKPYVCASVAHAGRRFNVNVHICHRGDPVHKDSLAFMDILRRRPDLRLKYEAAKDHAHAIDPSDPQVYNKEKKAVSSRTSKL